MEVNSYFQDIDTLKPATESANTAEEAAGISEKKQVAVLINTAAIANQREAIYQRPMSMAMQRYLSDEGYTVRPWRHTAQPGDMWIIEW